MGHYTKAYAGVLAFACTGSLVVAVQAHDKAATLGALDAKADRWEAWARNEHLRDARTYAQYGEVDRRYRALARQVERSRRRLLREIAATRSLHRSVVMGAPVVSYVRVRKLVPAAAAAPPAATTVSATTGGAARRGRRNLVRRRTRGTSLRSRHRETPPRAARPQLEGRPARPREW